MTDVILLSEAQMARISPFFPLSLMACLGWMTFG